jgi:hypothetical protein
LQKFIHIDMTCIPNWSVGEPGDFVIGTPNGHSQNELVGVIPSWFELGLLTLKRKQIQGLTCIG